MAMALMFDAVVVLPRVIENPPLPSDCLPITMAVLPLTVLATPPAKAEGPVTRLSSPIAVDSGPVTSFSTPKAKAWAEPVPAKL